MKPQHIAVAVLLAGALVTGVVLLVLPHEAEPASPSEPAPEQTAPDALPSFRAERSSEAPAQPISVPASDVPAARDEAPAARRETVPRRTVSGVVLRISDGSPLAGVEVGEPRPKGGKLDEQPVVARTDDEGRFELAVRRDAAEIVVTSTGPWPRRSQSYAIEPGDGDLPDLRLTYDSGFTIAVLVLGEEGGQLAGARVDASGVQFQDADESGRCLLRDVSPPAGVASLSVSAKAPGHAKAGRDVIVPRDPRARIELELRLPIGGAIAGHVSNGDGAPLAGVAARVAFEMTEEHGSEAPQGLAAFSDERGDYLIDSVPEGRYVVEVGYGTDVTLTLGELPSGTKLGLELGEPTANGELRSTLSIVDSRDTASRWFSGIVVTAGRTTRLDVQLSAPGSISGRVTDDDGAPVADAKVTIDRLTRWTAPDINGSLVTRSDGFVISSEGSGDGRGETVLEQRQGSARTGADGRYELDALSDGEMRLTVTAEGLVDQGRELSLLPAEVRTGEDFRLEHGLSLRGRVRDPHGNPIEGASVQVGLRDAHVFSGDPALTDGDGRFEVIGLSSGTMQVVVFKPGFVAHFQDFEPGGPELDVVLAPAPMVVGYVTHAVQGVPITRFDVSISYEGSTWTNTGGDYPEGRFELPIDEDTPCTVSVWAGGFRKVVIEDVLPSRTALVPLQVRLQPE